MAWGGFFFKKKKSKIASPKVLFDDTQLKLKQSQKNYILLIYTYFSYKFQ